MSVSPLPCVCESECRFESRGHRRGACHRSTYARAPAPSARRRRGVRHQGAERADECRDVRRHDAGAERAHRPVGVDALTEGTPCAHASSNVFGKPSAGDVCANNAAFANSGGDAIGGDEPQDFHVRQARRLRTELLKVRVRHRRGRWSPGHDEARLRHARAASRTTASLIGLDRAQPQNRVRPVQGGAAAPAAESGCGRAPPRCPVLAHRRSLGGGLGQHAVRMREAPVVQDPAAYASMAGLSRSVSKSCAHAKTKRRRAPAPTVRTVRSTPGRALVHDIGPERARAPGERPTSGMEEAQPLIPANGA
jgi:hypothetical protein